jgi:hypothetical protein
MAIVHEKILLRRFFYNAKANINTLFILTYVA